MFISDKLPIASRHFCDGRMAKCKEVDHKQVFHLSPNFPVTEDRVTGEAWEPAPFSSGLSLRQRLPAQRPIGQTNQCSDRLGEDIMLGSTTEFAGSFRRPNRGVGVGRTLPSRATMRH